MELTLFSWLALIFTIVIVVWTTIIIVRGNQLKRSLLKEQKRLQEQLVKLDAAYAKTAAKLEEKRKEGKQFLK